MARGTNQGMTMLITAARQVQLTPDQLSGRQMMPRGIKMMQHGYNMMMDAPHAPETHPNARAKLFNNGEQYEKAGVDFLMSTNRMPLGGKS